LGTEDDELEKILEEQLKDHQSVAADEEDFDFS
jgi:hypothetical protein